MIEDNNPLNEFLKALSSNFNIWVIPLNEKAETDLLNELREIIGEENWDAYIQKQRELNKLKEE